MRISIRLEAGRPAPVPFLRLERDPPVAGVRLTGPGGLDARVQSSDVDQLAVWAAALSQAADQLAAAQLNRAGERRRLQSVPALVDALVAAVEPRRAVRSFWSGPFVGSSS